MGPRSAVLYSAVVADNAQLGALTLVMKGEYSGRLQLARLPGGTRAGMILTLPLAATLPQGTRLISMADSAAEQYLLVIGIETPHSTLRDAARAIVRSVASVVLGTILDCRPDAVPLASAPGQPLRLDLPGQWIGLSVTMKRACRCWRSICTVR